VIDKIIIVLYACEVAANL